VSAWRRRAAIGAAAALAGCTERPPDRAAAPERAAESQPADRLVLTAPGDFEIWYTLARSGQADDGTSCVDRTLEIRRDTTRIRVPLLYTGSAPELVNDSTIRARLSDRCRPGKAYLVNLRTGRPTPDRQP